MNPECDGRGNCLTQIDINEYEKNTEIQCEYDCQIKLCPNYGKITVFGICQSKGPEWYFLCHHKLCTHCDMERLGMFKKTRKNMEIYLANRNNCLI